MSRAAVQLMAADHKKKERAAKDPLKSGALSEWEETVALYLGLLTSQRLSLFSRQPSCLQSLF